MKKFDLNRFKNGRRWIEKVPLLWRFAYAKDNVFTKNDESQKVIVIGVDSDHPSTADIMGVDSVVDGIDIDRAIAVAEEGERQTRQQVEKNERMEKRPDEADVLLFEGEYGPVDEDVLRGEIGRASEPEGPQGTGEEPEDLFLGKISLSGERGRVF